MQHDTLLPLRIHAITYAAEGVLLFKLRSPVAAAVAPFEPGAHVDVQLPGGLMRSYSLLNDAQERAPIRDRSQAGSTQPRWIRMAARLGTCR